MRTGNENNKKWLVCSNNNQHTLTEPDEKMMELLKPNNDNLLFNDIGFPKDTLGEPTFEELKEAGTPSPFTCPEEIITNNKYEDDSEQWFSKPSQTPTPTVLIPSKMNEENNIFLVLVNNARAELGLDPVQWSDHLTTASKWHSDDMMNRDFFKHLAPEGAPHGETFGERILNSGIVNRGKFANETIAVASSPEGAFEVWRNSPPHWGALMHKNTRYIGLANAGKYWTSLQTYNNIFNNPPPPLIIPETES